MTPCYGAFVGTIAGVGEWNANDARCSPGGPGSSSPERSGLFVTSSTRGGSSIGAAVHGQDGESALDRFVAW